MWQSFFLHISQWRQVGQWYSVLVTSSKILYSPEEVDPAAMAAVTESRHMEAWSQSSVVESFESSQHGSLSQDQSDNQWHLVVITFEFHSVTVKIVYTKSVPCEFHRSPRVTIGRETTTWPRTICGQRQQVTHHRKCSVHIYKSSQCSSSVIVSQHWWL